ncbi:OsmC family protein [Rhodocaloribacter sp.]
MATVNVKLEQLDDSFHFRASNADGNTVDIDDATSREDGVGKGVGPMQLVVMALGGCSAVDIVSILRKSRQKIDTFTIDVTGEKPDGVSPSLYERIHVHYALTGDLDANRVRRAVDLSLNKYCSVAKTLEPTARITASFSVNGERFDLTSA